MTADISKNVVLVLLALVVVVASLGTWVLTTIEPAGEATALSSTGNVAVNIGSEFDSPAESRGHVSLSIRDVEES